MVLEYHFALKDTKLLGEMCRFIAEVGNEQELRHFVILGSKDAIKTTRILTKGSGANLDRKWAI